jgi:RND family efflux transporter MFP subunit
MPFDTSPSGAEGGSPISAPAVRRSHRGLLIAGAVALGVAVIVVITGLNGRAHETSQTKTWTTAEAIPAVTVVSPMPEAGAQSLVLPGNLQAFYNAPIYSRVSGYVHTWLADIGAQVKTGQLLATIETPELDQQLIQARADLESAKANMQLAATTAQRWTRLLGQDAVSKQEAEEKTGDLAAKTAQVNAAKANVDRLLAMKAFSRIVAPFDGVVTARKTDIGALVNAGAGATTNSELFDVAKVDRLRLYVRVPQGDSARLHPGVTATMTVPEYPGRTFPAKLVTTANSVSDSSGTLLVELMVDNAADALKAGDYAQVKFDFPGAPSGSAAGTLRLPSSALLFRKSGMEAAIIEHGDRIRLQHVTVGRDLGTSIEVTSGLTPSDQVVNNPPDSLANGELVRVIQPDAVQHGGGANAPG